MKKVATLPALASVALPTPTPVAPAAPPATRYTIGGKITAFRADDTKREPVRGPTLTTTADAYDKAKQVRERITSGNFACKQFPPERKCLFPHGEPGTKQFRFCHAYVTTPGPYCDQCRGHAYTNQIERTIVVFERFAARGSGEADAA